MRVTWGGLLVCAAMTAAFWASVWQRDEARLAEERLRAIESDIADLKRRE